MTLVNIVWKHSKQKCIPSEIAKELLSYCRLSLVKVTAIICSCIHLVIPWGLEPAGYWYATSFWGMEEHVTGFDTWRHVAWKNIILVIWFIKFKFKFIMSPPWNGETYCFKLRCLSVCPSVRLSVRHTFVSALCFLTPGGIYTNV